MKDDTKTEWRRRVEKALIRLLDSIGSQVSFNEAAHDLASSPFHFHRQFRRMTGETFKSCCDRIRLEKAMVMLRDTRDGITEIAYACGYTNSEMLSKAVRKAFGLSPTELRRQRSWHPQLGAANNFHYLKNSEKETWFYLNGGLQSMKTKIIEFGAKTVYGYSCTGDYWKLPGEWEKLHAIMSAHNLHAAATEYMSVFPDHNPEIPQEKKKALAGFVTGGQLEDGLDLKILDVPKGLYAVTVHYGSSEEIGPVWERWMENWLPDSGWKLDYSRPSYEWYQNRPENPEMQLTFLVTPVKK